MTSQSNPVDLHEFAQTLGQEIAAALAPRYLPDEPRFDLPSDRPIDPSNDASYEDEPEQFEEGAAAPSVGLAHPVDLSHPDVQERFLPALSAILPAVISTVPALIKDVRRRHRDLAPEVEDPQQAQEELQAVLAEIVPKLVESLPELLVTAEVEAATLDPGDPAAGTRFLGALLSGPLIPTLINTVPGVISTLAGTRGDLGVAAQVDPEITSRFLGNVLGGVLGGVVPQLGGVINTVLAGGAGVGVPAQRPAGPQRPSRPAVRPARPTRPARPADPVRR